LPGRSRNTRWPPPAQVVRHFTPFHLATAAGWRSLQRMKRNLIFLLTLTTLLTPAVLALAADEEAGFKSLMDGKTFDGWKVTTDSPSTWTIKDGAFVANGNRAHLYYVGDEQSFTNFHLKVEVMTDPVSNGGIYFHTKYQADGWPKTGIECQVNNTHGDWKKTGSLYDIANIGVSSAQDNKWWTQEIIVDGNTVTVLVDGKKVLQYVEPAGAQPGKEYTRKLNEGTFCLQGHDPKSTIRYKNIRVKRL
jgi:hypothetical protein